MRHSLALLALFCFNEHILPTTARYHIVRRQNDGGDTTGHAAYVDTAIRVAAPRGLVNHASYIDSQIGTEEEDDIPSVVSATYSGGGSLSTTIPSAVASSISSAASTTTAGLSTLSIASPISSALASTDDAVKVSRDSETTPQSACQEALAALNGSISNPSGMTVCYNVIMFDNTTGLFQSDLGLYKVEAPSGQWASIPEADINVDIMYPWATVAGQNAQNTKRSTLSQSHRPVGRALLEKRDAPLLVKDMGFIGQVDDMVGEMTNETAMMIAVMPVVTLSGTLANGTVLSTTLSNTDASFVTGVFMDMPPPNMTTTAAPEPAVATQPSAGTTAAPFTYPGVALGIFPVGLIVTSSWVFLFILFVGLGTLRRFRVRAIYRRRQRETRMGPLPRVSYSMFTILVDGIKDGISVPYRL